MKTVLVWSMASPRLMELVVEYETSELSCTLYLIHCYNNIIIIMMIISSRDGEDLDELLERQADMIRYLQQHNANLGRRILELQSQALE